MSFDAIATSAFGRRPVTRAQIEAQIVVKQARLRIAGQGASNAPAAHKWTLLRTLSEIRGSLGVSDRTLGVLSALLSFHPETALTLAPDAGREGRALDGGGGGESAHAGLVVFPSNKALALRCNGMSEATLRRHLSALVEAGLIIRRDSPNGKRFARRAPDGPGAPFAQAYGFDLSPLAARAGEFEERLEALDAERRRVLFLKERLTLLRRDLAKRLAFALAEALPGPWDGLRRTFLGLCTPLRKLRGAAAFDALAAETEQLHAQATAAIETALGGRSEDKSTGDAAQSGRRITESNTEQIPDFEPVSEEAGEDHAAHASPAMRSDGKAGQIRELPLALVLDACPDIRDYDFSGGRLDDWREFVDAAAHIRPMLGISPDAWGEAVAAMGEKGAAVAVAFILQRCEYSSEVVRHVGWDGRTTLTVGGAPAIRSPGGYLRALTDKARAEPFTLWGAILGRIAQRTKPR